LFVSFILLFFYSLDTFSCLKDAPRVRIILGAKIDGNNIREGMDVYFDCLVEANPWVSDVSWFFEGQILTSDPSSGIIISNQSLVLQKVKKASRGRYWCSASNHEGRGESDEYFLRVLCEYFLPLFLVLISVFDGK